MAPKQTPEQLLEHFEIERELARRLRLAPTKEERRRLYSVVYRERSERIAHHPLVQQAADPAARADAVVPQARLIAPFLTPTSTFLEIGAGDGAVARRVATSVARSIAMDVADVLALPDADRFEFRTFDGFATGLAPGSVDVVYSNDVAEHLHPDDMVDQAREILRVLRPGGLYICVTPNRLTGPHDVSGHFGVESPQGFHLHEYTATELARALQAAGFRRVSLVLTYRGRRLSPMMPVRVIWPVEWVVGLLPRSFRRRLGPVLAAIKVVASA